MPALVEKLSYAKFNERSVPWWGTGSSEKEAPVEGRYLTTDEAKDTFPWGVILEPSYQRLSNGSFREVEDSYQVVLNHNNPLDPDHEMVLGVVGKLYSVEFQPEDMIDFAAELVDHHGFVFDTVGDLKRHQMIFCSLKLSEFTALGESAGIHLDESLAGHHDWYVLLTNYLNGNGSLRGDIVPIRTVCANTHSFNLRFATNTWKVRHVGDISSRVGEARRTLGLISNYEKAYAEIVTKLADVDCELAQFEKMCEELLPTQGDEIGVRVKNANIEAHEGLVRNFLTTPTITDELRFTNWGALNSMTEWSEHLYEPRTDRRTAEKDRRMLRTFYGGAQAGFRDRALAVVGGR